MVTTKTCKDYEKMIPYFIGGKLPDKDVEELLGHVENCPACKEELRIQFMVSEGLSKLEENGTFDLEKDLDKLIYDSLYNIRVKTYTKIGLFISIGLLASVAVAAIIILIF